MGFKTGFSVRSGSGGSAGSVSVSQEVPPDSARFQWARGPGRGPGSSGHGGPLTLTAQSLSCWSALPQALAAASGNRGCLGLAWWASVLLPGHPRNPGPTLTYCSPSQRAAQPQSSPEHARGGWHTPGSLERKVWLSHAPGALRRLGHKARGSPAGGASQHVLPTVAKAALAPQDEERAGTCAHF